MSTVHQAYGLLESAGVFVAMPRSGFYLDGAVGRTSNGGIRDGSVRQGRRARYRSAS